MSGIHNSLYKTKRIAPIFFIVVTASLASCGGGGSGSSGGNTNPPPVSTSLTDTQRSAAAKTTAEQSAQCTKIAPFYWEVGNQSASLASGSVGGSTYTATSLMNIASASKWIYASYVGQKRGGLYAADDIKFLTFSSGYSNFSKCAQMDSVHSCAVSGTNGTVTAANSDKFFYDGGHMQAHADQFMSLGSYTNSTLASEVNTTLALNASAADFTYSQPQLAGGVATTPNVYASFLRKLLDGSLKLGSQLSANGVCTNPGTCAQAVKSPFPANETPLYALGHWIEDTTNSDGAFSSAGLFGFYPWIDAKSEYYGIVARAALIGTTSTDPQVQPYTQSMFCGRLIRKAWLSGQAQP